MEAAVGGGLSPSELDAHRQVLEMARTIEELQRDFANMQEELSAAYEQLRERPAGQKSDEGESPRRKECWGGGGGDGRCCSHEQEARELKKLIEVKDVALKEALDQRNLYRVELDKAEVLIRELRSLHIEVIGGRGNASSLKTAVVPSCAWYSSGTADVRVPPSLSASALLGTSGSIAAPHTERFDDGSSYQKKENDSLFWRKQYREAVRMRKKPGVVTTTGSSRNITTTSKPEKPSLKIFSAPNTQRQRVITDESIPFSRYIGISARQHEIIKEQHRILS